MELRTAKKQLEGVSKYFRGFTLELKDKERGNPFAPRLVTSIEDISVQCFLGNYDDLLSAAIANYRSISIEQGRRKGVEQGKEIRSSELRDLLNIQEYENSDN